VLFTTIRQRIALRSWRPDLALVFLVLWGLFIVYATTLPFDFSGTWERAEMRLHTLWLRPLRGGSWGDVGGNVLLFVPWGAFLAAYASSRGVRVTAILTLALLSGACLSASVELLQLFSRTRFTSFVDLVTNTFGSTVGALVTWPVLRWLWPAAVAPLRQFVTRRPLKACCVCVVAGFLLAGVAPFRVRTQPHELKQAMHNARLMPFGGSRHGTALSRSAALSLQELLTWALVGGLFALAAKEAAQGDGMARITATASAAGLSVLLQGLHLLVRGREIDVTSVFLALVASSVGAGVAINRFAEPRRAIMPALLIWGLAALFFAWDPLAFASPAPPYWQPEWFVPFWSYFDSRTLEDLADVVWQALRFAPLGALLAARSWRQSFLQAGLIGLGFSALLEVGQVFLPGRTTDVSDAIVAAAGTVAGWALWRWGESLRSSSQGHVKYRVVKG
jgi:glycopeptide antibiotics resistance protein